MRFSAFFLLGVLLCSPVFAEELRVGAQVDKSEISTGETLTFSVMIAGPMKETPKVQLTAFDGFQVVSTGQSQQIQIRPDQTQLALTLTYTLAPTQPGIHTLGPIKVEYQGKVYETQPVEVKVVPGPALERKIPEGKRKPNLPKPRLEGGVIL